ncbi:hypothetical protein [Ferrovibrio sp.]|uniref:hypothetical protein n=1 Tax=Ferrovibrio sp. TaxID=1917215 RepID=UPI0035AF57DF
MLFRRRIVAALAALAMLWAGMLAPLLAAQAMERTAMERTMSLSAVAQMQTVETSHDCHNASQSEAAVPLAADMHSAMQNDHGMPCPPDCQFCAFCAIAAALPAPAVETIPEALALLPGLLPNGRLPSGRSLSPPPEPPRA